MSEIKKRRAFGVEFTVPELIQASGYARTTVRNYMYKCKGNMEAVCEMLGLDDAEKLRNAIMTVRCDTDDAVDRIMGIIGGDEEKETETDDDSFRHGCAATPPSEMEDSGDGLPSSASLTPPPEEEALVADEVVEPETEPETEADEIAEDEPDDDIDGEIRLLRLFRNAHDALEALLIGADAAGKDEILLSMISLMRRDIDAVAENEFRAYVTVDYDAIERRMRGEC